MCTADTLFCRKFLATRQGMDQFELQAVDEGGEGIFLHYIDDLYIKPCNHSEIEKPHSRTLSSNCIQIFMYSV